jgi:plasmid replication initiation protein
MGTIEQKLSNYVWDNLSELESIFSERVYRILSRFRAKEDREGFSDTLGLVLEQQFSFKKLSNNMLYT